MSDLMRSTNFWLIFSFAIGFGLILFLNLLFYFVRRAQALVEAEEIIEEAKEKAKDLEDAAKKRVNDYSEQLWNQAEPQIKAIEDKIAKLEETTNAHELQLSDKYEEHEAKLSRRMSEVDQYQNHVLNYDKKIEQRKQVVKAMREDFIRNLEKKSESQVPALKEELQKKILDERQVESSKFLQNLDEELAATAEIEAKKLINMVLNRFARPYCPERGIGYLNFETPEQRDKVLGPDQSHLRQVEKLCGVDLVYDENNNAVNVYGFDPVRRELGRATVEKMFTEKNINLQKIEDIYAKVKRDLFNKIVQDGDRIVKELRLDGMSKEIKNMMGALRYRYSFTQNQYFHCAEVGFLAGLLAAELDIPIHDARRAGLLHDIGKAMDHTMEGGHAVIGADFIKQHGEKEHIVHAVRSHHFDETPSTNLAFTVIAADALSGARPGARRSTATSYTQKIQDLQSIATQFEGVVDTHIVNAGREVRVYVDGKILDDLKALELSRALANKIETEMSYPGQIKVTVVRATNAIEYAK